MNDPTNNWETVNLREQFEILSDEAIVERVCAGDVALFELIMRRHNQRLFRVVRGMLGNDHEAEDVVQETYYRAYARLEQFAGRAKFSTWLIKIAVYEASARRRKLGRVQLFDANAPEHSQLVSSSRNGHPETQTDNAEIAEILAAAVNDLPAELRTVFTMRAVEGIGTNETAECLSLTSSNVKIRLHRARAILRTTINRSIGEEVRLLYQFDGERCDRIVKNVLARLANT